VGEKPPLLIQPIFPYSPEWVQLVTTLWAEYVTDGAYSREEVEAMMDPQQHDVSWLPKGRHVMVVELGGFVDGALVGSVDLLKRDDDTAVVEQLAVYPDHRRHGYGRRLVREAVASARRAGLPMLEVFAFQREIKAIEFWSHLLRAAPTLEGHGVLLGERRPAKGWRVKTAEIFV
jgi:GNAT superfamily N-acetyltransferase